MPNSNLRPLQRYELALKSGEFSEDAQQRAAMTYLDNVYEQIMDNRAKQRGLFSFLRRTEPPKGLYMWGGVGRGKTWMMDMFFESAVSYTHLTLPTNREV